MVVWESFYEFFAPYGVYIGVDLKWVRNDFTIRIM